MVEFYNIAEQLKSVLSSPLHDGIVEHLEFNKEKAQLTFDVQLSCDSNDAFGWFGKLVFKDVKIIRSSHPFPETWHHVAYGGIVDVLYQPELDMDGKQGVLWVLEMRFLNNHEEQMLLEFVAGSLEWHPDYSKPSPYTDT